VSDRSSWLVRAVPLEGLAEEIRVKILHERWLPPPPPGFGTAGKSTVLLLANGDHPVWAVESAPAELRAFGRAIVRAVLLGPPQVLNHAPLVLENIDWYFRGLLDHVFLGARPAHLIRLALGEDPQMYIDRLWRLALAADARLTIFETADRVVLDVFASGRRGELAALAASWPRAITAAMFRTRASYSHDLPRRASQQLAVLVCNVDDPLPPVVPRVAVEFAEASNEEIARRPRRHGVTLSAAVQPDGDRHVFVGRVDHRVVFRLICNMHAPVLELLPAELREAFTDPVSLITDARTDPEFRNRSIFASGIQWVVGWAKQQAVRTVVTLIAADNAPSLRGAAKAGFRRVGEITVLQ
jgi:hypothetical protein